MHLQVMILAVEKSYPWKKGCVITNAQADKDQDQPRPISPSVFPNFSPNLVPATKPKEDNPSVMTPITMDGKDYFCSDHSHA